MANALYDFGRNAFATGAINWVDDQIACVLVDTAGYTVDLATHTGLDSIPAVDRIATGALTSKTAASGICDAADITLTGVTGDVSEAVVIYKDAATEGVSYLIAYIDTASAGLPVTPNGGDITITWASGANKIFKL